MPVILPLPELPPADHTVTMVEYDYTDLRAVGDAMNERHDCAIIATSVVTGYPYPRVHEMYRLLGRRKRCATNWVYIVGVFAQLGLKLNDISKFYEGASIRSIVPQLPSKGKFLIRSRKHVSAVRDGVAHDWAEQRKMYVKGLYQVVDLDEPMATYAPVRKRKVFIDYSQPTKAVWAIADALYEEEDAREGKPLHAGPSRQYWSTFRAKVVAECVLNGINKTTAAVQVGKWMVGQGLHHRFMT
jgi:hypothetical protein